MLALLHNIWPLNPPTSTLCTTSHDHSCDFLLSTAAEFQEENVFWFYILDYNHATAPKDSSTSASGPRGGSSQYEKTVDQIYNRFVYLSKGKANLDS